MLGAPSISASASTSSIFKFYFSAWPDMVARNRRRVLLWLKVLDAWETCLG
jgi:hypothetical protein